MSRFFKAASTIMIAIGFAFFYIYVQGQADSKLNIFQQPSYYMVQSYWFIFVSGIAVLIFSLLGSFFSWFKEFDIKEEILPNAGYASVQEIHTWVGEGSEAITTAMETGDVEATAAMQDETNKEIMDSETVTITEAKRKDLEATELFSEEGVESNGIIGRGNEL